MKYDDWLDGLVNRPVYEVTGSGYAYDFYMRPGRFVKGNYYEDWAGLGKGLGGRMFLRRSRSGQALQWRIRRPK